jgi:methenyltetrahydrofolate cyclohydrolase
MSDETLWQSGLAEFRDATASASPTPGGGSVAGVSATLGMGLVIMALEISAKRKDATEVEKMTTLIAEGREMLKELSDDADEDVRAFQGYMAALKLPKESDDEKAQRKAALQEATRGATEAPLVAGRHIIEALRIAELAGPLAHAHVVSDVGAGAALLEGALKAVLFNVDVNLPGVTDASAKAIWTEERKALAGEGIALAERVLAAVAGRLG